MNRTHTTDQKMLRSALFGACFFIIVVCDVTGGPRDSPCPPLRLKFGRARYRQKGRLVKFVCNTGYLIAGEKYSTCTNGTWDGPLPRCVRASCGKVEPPANGLIYPSHRGAVLNFFCKPGFDLHGPNVTYCDGHTWDNNLPACIASNTEPPLSCDFEAEDLCGWNQDLRHDFDWKRMSFKTPSGHLGTGPSYDHTKGQGQNGHYMYIESSSRNENDTARLVSPIFDRPNSTDVCLEFYYHMHGSTTGQLRAYLKRESADWDLRPRDALFWKMGNHGDRWLRSYTRTGPVQEDFQIIIEGVRGTSYFSDIAVDDVKIVPDCATSEETTTTATVDDVTYSENYEPYQSCSNRCDEDNLVVRPTERASRLASCDCDDNCRDRNSCCPDYVAACILGVTDDLSTADYGPTTGNNYDVDFSESSDTAAIATTTASLPTPSTRRPALVFLTPALTTIIFRKTNPPPTTPATDGDYPMSGGRGTTKLTFLGDMPTVSDRGTIDDEYTVYALDPTGGEVAEDTVPLGFQTKNGETTAEVPLSHAKLIAIAVVSVVLVTSAAVIVAVLAKRSRYLSCRSMSLKMTSGGDSQSDVRFLTSDEVLDFNLAHPDD